jgi:hypothetical protein
LAVQDNGSGHLTQWYKGMGFAQVGVNSRGYPQLEAPISRVLLGAAQSQARVRSAEPPQPNPDIQRSMSYRRITGTRPHPISPWRQNDKTTTGEIQRSRATLRIEGRIPKVIQRMDSEQPSKWVCAKCEFEIWDSDRPVYPCPKCQATSWQDPNLQDPNKKEILPKEEDYEILLLNKCHALQENKIYKISVTVAKKQKANAVVVPATWGAKKTVLLQLIQKFREGNRLPDGRTVHLGSGLDLSNETHKLVWCQIGQALVNIVKFVEDLLVTEDGKFIGLVSALIASGFMEELFSYIAKPSCNENGAARLNSALEKISFTGKEH